MPTIFTTLLHHGILPCRPGVADGARGRYRQSGVVVHARANELPPWSSHRPTSPVGHPLVPVAAPGVMLRGWVSRHLPDMTQRECSLAAGGVTGRGIGWAALPLGARLRVFLRERFLEGTASR